MPFTLCHPAAALPFQPLVRRGWIPLSALAVGTMVPDFEYFLHAHPLSRWSHSAAGLVTWCLPVGMVVLVIWEFVARDAMVDLFALGRIRRNEQRAGDAGRRNEQGAWMWWMGAVVGVLLGAATHLIWDGFTHDGGWGAKIFPALHSPAIVLAGRHPPVPWTVVADHISSAVGAVVVAVWLFIQLRRAGAGPVLARPGWRWEVMAAIATTAVAAGLWNARSFPIRGDYWKTELWLSYAAVGGLLGLGCAIILFGVAYRLRGDVKA